MITHRYIYPMRLVSVEVKDEVRHVRVEVGLGVVLTLEVPGTAEMKNARLILEVSEDAKS